ncbi:hypothetical protein EXIGLDRAFT_752341 [Exidia glandulosa HHB12029]|uniref:Uncharacterized protein n=1 Tax=Exidia glandulosa HHB12029 TaxID=1314781 RepID=A0A165EM64_EXIGL|nr:hypothetical protein EXIGLDRAFT_752341 [Exidia glandulosa HHB12029]
MNKKLRRDLRDLSFSLLPLRSSEGAADLRCSARAYLKSPILREGCDCSVTLKSSSRDRELSLRDLEFFLRQNLLRRGREYSSHHAGPLLAVCASHSPSEGAVVGDVGCRTPVLYSTRSTVLNSRSCTLDSPYDLHSLVFAARFPPGVELFLRQN